MTADEIIMQRLTTELSDAAYNDKTQAEGLAFLKATTVSSPVVRPMAFTMAELLTFLKPQSALKLVDWPMLGDLRDKVTEQDHAGVIAWLSFIKNSKIDADEFDDAYAHLTRTETVQVATEIIPRIWDVIRGIPSGPNDISDEQFAAAWLAAGRN